MLAALGSPRSLRLRSCAVVSGPENGQPDTAYIEREFCLKELRWAIAAEKTIVPVVDTAEKGNIAALVKAGPADLHTLLNIDFVDLNMSDKDYWTVGVNKIEKRWSSTRGSVGSLDC